MPVNFAYYLFVRELPEVRADLTVLWRRYEAVGNLPAAQVVKGAYLTLLAELEALSFEISAAGTEILRDHERRSRVRPDTGGEGGARLEDSLFVDPLTKQLPGSVGIANEDLLDSNVPWWSTNEEGSAARVGARLYGIFDPGGWIPDPIHAREHPLFSPLPSSGGEGGWMTIHKPIPARRFIEHAIPEIDALWMAGFNAIKGRLEATVASAAFV